MRINDNTHAELLNWSRWCWQGSWPHPLPATHCGSLEAQYRAPPDWNPDDPPEPPSIRPNERNARIVQRVYDRLQDPQRQALKAEYPGRHTSGRIESKAVAAARLGMPEWAYDRHLEAAVGQVEKEFQLAAR